MVPASTDHSILTATGNCYRTLRCAVCYQKYRPLNAKPHIDSARHFALSGLIRQVQNDRSLIYWAGVHLHLTGETIAPSFLSSANTLSTTFLSRPERVATSPAATGLPASRIVFSTNSFSILINIKSLTKTYSLEIQHHETCCTAHLSCLTAESSRDRGGCSIHIQLQPYRPQGKQPLPASL